MEGLTKAGVFDEFDQDRSKIFNSIPKIIQEIKNVNDDKKIIDKSFDIQDNFKKEFEFLPSKKWKQKSYLQKNLKH